MSIVLDSSVIIAFYNKRDQDHQRGLDFFKKLENKEFGGVFLSDYVFDEVVTYALSHLGKNKALQLGEWIFACDFIFVPTSKDIFDAAWQIFRKTNSLSFTDCILADLARRHNSQLSTFDGGFKELKDLRIVS